MKKLLWLFPLFLLSAASVDDTPKEILLWPKGAPGSEGKTGKESVRLYEGEHIISSVHAPSITPYLPSPEKATGAAIIIAPGGGHRELWFDHEGHNPGKWFSERGVAAIILKYRLSKEPNSTYTIDHELLDIQRAIRYVRGRAREWKINPDKIGVMGFSAGGELAALSAMHFDNGKPNAADTTDRQSCKPNFQILIYPGNSETYQVTKDSPPLFVLGGYNDRDDIALGMAQLYEKYKRAGVPAELHIYAKPGHGFGLRERNAGAVAGWPQRIYEWIDDLNLLAK
jgi:endo-1,4-beta-xylanase